MGLRFRKSINILPGVRLNFGKETSSISIGIPGFRKTINTKGKVTTTVGIPGTGLYYVDTKTAGKKAKKEEKETRRAVSAAKRESLPEPKAQAEAAQPRRFAAPLQISANSLCDIHKTVDDSIDWDEILMCEEAPGDGYNQEMWRYYHGMAADIINGDIDAYLKLIYEVNPLDDLLDYGSGFTFGTDDPNHMEVEFTVNEAALEDVKAGLKRGEYNNLLQDFVSSTAIRIARDIFALLPVRRTIVHAVLKDETVLSVSFDKATISRLRFGFLDPSDTLAKFKHNMDYSDSKGFAPVDRLED